MLLATGLLVRAGDDSSIAVILDAVNSRLQASGQLGWDLQLAALLLALAMILKSAQLPVHGWLIQVMEAPTPVSALLRTPGWSTWVVSCCCALPRCFLPPCRRKACWSWSAA